MKTVVFYFFDGLLVWDKAEPAIDLVRADDLLSRNALLALRATLGEVCLLLGIYFSFL